MHYKLYLKDTIIVYEQIVHQQIVLENTIKFFNRYQPILKNLLLESSANDRAPPIYTYM